MIYHNSLWESNYIKEKIVRYYINELGYDRNDTYVLSCSSNFQNNFADRYPKAYSDIVREAHKRFKENINKKR